MAQFRHRLVVALDDGEHLQRGNQAVAGRGIIRQDNVAGLFATDIVTARAHALEHIAVADRRAHQLQANAAEIALEAEIGHHGGDDAGLAETAVFLPACGDDGEQLVAVDDLAVLVDDHHAVGVAIERDADIGAHLAHLAGDGAEVGRTAILIDVHAVRFVADGNHVGAQFPQRAGRDLVGGAIGAIDHDAQSGEIDVARQRALGEFNVAVLHAVDALGAAKVVALGQLLVQFGIEQVLDLAFDLVRQLEAVWSEQFDAVVGIGIMRGGNHHAEIGAHRAHQHADAGRRDRAGQQDIHTHGREAGDQSGFDHVTGQAGVLADQHAVPMLAILENETGGLPHFERQFRRNDLVGQPANTVGAEITTNHEIP